MLTTIGEWFNGSRENQLPGKGIFCPLHLVLIVIFFLTLFFHYLLSKKSSKYANIFILVCCIIMPISRIVRSIMELSFGLKAPLEILPFHLCHLMSLVIPIAYFFKLKKIYPCVMFYGIIGGVLTFLFGDYYKYNVLNFYDIESIVLHFMLPMVAISSYVLKEYRFTYKNIHYIIIFLLLLCGWAMIGNYLTGANFMYLKENGLPFKLLPGHHFFTYLLIAFVVFFLMYLPYIIRHFHHQSESNDNDREKIDEGKM